MVNSTDNQTPQPVDELDTILAKLVLPVSPEEHKRIKQAKARLLQWGTRQQIKGVNNFCMVLNDWDEFTPLPGTPRQYVESTRVQFIASLKDGGNRNKCLDCGKQLPDDYPFTYCDNDWEKHHPNPVQEKQE